MRRNDIENRRELLEKTEIEHALDETDMNDPEERTRTARASSVRMSNQDQDP